jgi:hypothetical protein
MKEEKVLQHYRHIPMKVDANQILTGLGTGQGTWGASNLLLTKLTTVSTRTQKRRDAPVLPSNLETFVQAIELLADQRRCQVGLIGVGRGDTTFGPHILASFPTLAQGQENRLGVDQEGKAPATCGDCRDLFRK